MPMSDWNENWEKLRNVCRKRSLSIHNWRLSEEDRENKNPNPPAIVLVEPPASETEIVAIENEMGRSIPSSFRKVLREYSRKIDVCWMFPDGDEEYESIYNGLFRSFAWGIFNYSLESLPDLQKELKGWNDALYNNPDDPYDKHWLGKFAVCEVGHQDYIVIESEHEDSQKVVYLSHDGDTDVNGFPFGKDFEDFLDRMSLLGCPAESYMFYPFMSESEPYLQIDSENAHAWRKWFGLET